MLYKNQFKMKQPKTYFFKYMLSRYVTEINTWETYVPFLIKNKKSSLIKNKKSSLIKISLRQYPLFLRNYKRNLNLFHGAQKIINLNFPRNRFFPSIKTLKGETYTFLSLGMFSKFFTQNKSFFKTKTMYLLLAGFLRKILLFSSLKFLYMIITKIPAYLKEIMDTINSSVIATYAHPFNEDITINEKTTVNPFKFSFLLFLNNKPYGKVKVKKKGRLKRKITKRLTQINKVLD